MTILQGSHLYLDLVARSSPYNVAILDPSYVLIHLIPACLPTQRIFRSDQSCQAGGGASLLFDKQIQLILQLVGLLRDLQGRNDTVERREECDQFFAGPRLEKTWETLPGAGSGLLLEREQVDSFCRAMQLQASL